MWLKQELNSTSNTFQTHIGRHKVSSFFGAIVSRNDKQTQIMASKWNFDFSAIKNENKTLFNDKNDHFQSPIPILSNSNLPDEQLNTYSDLQCTAVTKIAHSSVICVKS